MMMRILDLPLPNPQIVKILALHVGQGFYCCLRGYRAIVGNPLFSYICSLSCLVLFLFDSGDDSLNPEVRFPVPQFPYFGLGDCN